LARCRPGRCGRGIEGTSGADGEGLAVLIECIGEMALGFRQAGRRAKKVWALAWAGPFMLSNWSGGRLGGVDARC